MMRENKQTNKQKNAANNTNTTVNFLSHSQFVWYKLLDKKKTPLTAIAAEMERTMITTNELKIARCCEYLSERTSKRCVCIYVNVKYVVSNKCVFLAFVFRLGNLLQMDILFFTR